MSIWPMSWVRELARLQVDDDKALEQVVVEHQVHEEVAGLGADAHLPRHE
jgi:hypothetical protein